ncbi:MAG TPA: hypothetical protein VF881_00635 [Polyangiaceae bacterium]
MASRLTRFAIVSAFCATVGPAQAATDSTTDPVLASAPGGALMRRNRFLPWRPIERGTRLLADSELTCPGGCTLHTFDHNTLTLDPEARVAIGQLTFVPMGGATAAIGRRYELKEGSVTATVADDPKRPRTVVIGTPKDGIVALRPGEAYVAVKDGRAAAGCIRGGARVKQAHVALELRAGEATLLSGNGSLRAHAMVPAPLWQAATGKPNDPQPLGVAVGSRGGRPALAWQPVQGATGYRFQLATDAAFTNLIDAAKIGAEEQHFTAKNLAQGAYFGRVMALDADGLSGAPSEPAPVRVIAIDLPVGGFAGAEASTLVAPAGSTIQFSDRTNLEMAIDDHRFGPASADWTVDRTAHVVRLRAKNDFGRETSILVAPRGLRADVELGSAWARWPADPVDISVTLLDPTGEFDPVRVAPVLQVLIGVEPVSVDWTREGSKLTARLAPRAASRPEVVRVIVHDQDGALLGRNFLEIEPSLPPLPSAPQLAHR